MIFSFYSCFCLVEFITVAMQGMAGLGSQDVAPITLKWNPKNLEIKTRGVERTLEPLVIQVS